MANKVDVDQLKTDDPALARFARQVIQAIRTLDTRFLGSLTSRALVWSTFGVRGPVRHEAYYETRTTDATQTRLAQFPLRDNCVSKINCPVTGRSTANTGYSVELEVAYKRNGTSVAIVGGGAVTLVNEREDTAGFAATLSTVTVNSDVYVVVLVTGAASTTMDWSCTPRVQEQPTVPR